MATMPKGGRPIGRGSVSEDGDPSSLDVRTIPVTRVRPDVADADRGPADPPVDDSSSAPADDAHDPGDTSGFSDHAAQPADEDGASPHDHLPPPGEPLRPVGVDTTLLEDSAHFEADDGPQGSLFDDGVDDPDLDPGNDPGFDDDPDDLLDA